MTSHHLGDIGPGTYYLPGAGYEFGLGLGFGVRTESGVSPFQGNAQLDSSGAWMDSTRMSMKR